MYLYILYKYLYILYNIFRYILYIYKCIYFRTLVIVADIYCREICLMLDKNFSNHLFPVLITLLINRLAILYFSSVHLI